MIKRTLSSKPDYCGGIIYWNYHRDTVWPNVASFGLHGVELRSNSELKARLDMEIFKYQVKGYAHKETPQELANSDPHHTW